jgi:hypothetical protein
MTCVRKKANMMNESTSDVAAQGPTFSVRYAKDAQGRMNALAFLAQEAPAKDVRRFQHWFHVLAAQGQMNKTEALGHERGPIFAFKAFQCGIPCFRHGDTWFLTHGFIKEKDRWPEAEFQRAERIMAEHLARKGT